MNRTIVIGTSNPDKLKELKKLLKGLPLRVSALSDLVNPIPEVEENARSFEGNARKKARIYSVLTGGMAFADDSGLCVAALKGKPGVYSARFAGPGCTYDDNNRKLMGLLNGLPAARRKAFFQCTVALYDRGRHIKTLKAVCRGRIAPSICGHNGFGYDPVFIPDGFKRTFSQMSPAQKNRISHRGKALQKLKAYLKEYLKKR